jgi:O-acetyl-ADP-ribose deacetylase (regulator of RNase III)
MLERILLVDNSVQLVRAWNEVFRGVEIVEASVGDYFDWAADAMVSPANSFGIMDGGIDLAIRDQLGPEVERRVRKVIEEKHHGEMPIGCAEVVATDHSRWPFLVSAPTMRIPEDVSRTVHAYWAFRAVLLAVLNHDPPIRSLLCPGLATGVGRMPPRRCAVQMHHAWLQVTGEASAPSFQRIHTHHKAMKTVD